MTKNDWILDVLADLRSFAKSNDLPALAEQLADTMLVPAEELASQGGGPRAEAYGNAGDIGSASRVARRRQHA